MSNNKIADVYLLSQAGNAMTVSTIEKDADIALNTVVKIETGESPNPTVETLEKIAKALGVSMAELFK